METFELLPFKTRKPGRPNAIPETMEPFVLESYHRGYGYRAIAGKLRTSGITVDWSTIRRIIKRKTSTNLTAKPEDPPKRIGLCSGGVHQHELHTCQGVKLPLCTGTVKKEQDKNCNHGKIPHCS